MNYKYFEVVNVEFENYLADPSGRSTGEITIGEWVSTMRPNGGTQFKTISEAVREYLAKPFSMNPTDWWCADGYIETEVVCSTPAEYYIPFCKKATKQDISAWQQGKQDLYIVHFSIKLSVVVETDDLDEYAAAEGISIV